MLIVALVTSIPVTAVKISRTSVIQICVMDHLVASSNLALGHHHEYLACQTPWVDAKVSVHVHDHGSFLPVLVGQDQLVSHLLSVHASHLIRENRKINFKSCYNLLLNFKIKMLGVDG